MPKIAIQGVGEVEIDSKFLTLSPEDQDKELQSIVAAVRGGSDHAQRQTGTDGALASTLQSLYPGVRITGTGRSAARNAAVNGASDSYHLDHDAVDFQPPKGVSIAQVKRDFAKRGIKLNEALAHDAGSGFHYHIAYAGDGNPTPPATVTDQEPQADPQDSPDTDGVMPLPERPNIVPKRQPAAAQAVQGGPNVFQRHLNAANDGIADTLGAPVDVINSALGAVGLPMSDTPFGGAKSIQSVMDYLGITHEGKDWAPRSSLENYTQSAARGVGQAIVPGLGLEAAASRAGVRALPAAARSIGRELTAGATSGLGAQAGRDIAPGNPYAELAGSLIGGGIGAGAIGDTRQLLAEAKTRRFVNDQVANNPNAAIDAAVSGDLKTILDNRPTRPSGKAMPKRMTDLTVLSRVNDLARSYLNDGAIAGLDALPSQKSALRDALRNPYIQTAQDLESLKALPGGEAVAERIMKAQSLRRSVPEGGVSSSNEPTFLGAVADTAATAGGAAIGGVPGAVAGRLAGVAVRKALSPDGARQLVKAAQARAALAPAYEQAAGIAAAADTSARGLAGQAGLKAWARKALDRTQAADASQPVPDDRLPAINGVQQSASAQAQQTALNAANAADAAKGKRLVVDIVGSGGDQATGDMRDAAYLAKKAAAKAKADEALKAAALEADNRRVGINNDRDNVTPGGGWRGYLYNRTGLLPADQDAGMMMLLKDGKIAGSQFAAHLSTPADLMTGNAGNAIADRLSSMAEDGTLSRDPAWSPPSSSSVDPTADGSTVIRNPLAYAATAKGNQDRVSAAIQRTQDHPTMDTKTKAAVGNALATLGNTSSKADANTIVANVLSGLPEESKADALALLSPIAGQIKR